MSDPKIHLVVATPCWEGKLSSLYINSMLQLQPACRKKSVALEVWAHPGDALIPRARQDLAARFMAKPGATHLLFIDGDIGFKPEQVFRLLDFDTPATAAIYPHKWLDPQKLKALVLEGKNRPDEAALSYVFDPEKPGMVETRNDFVRVRYAGTGFLMLKREALTLMIEKYPELLYKGSEGETGALFNCMIAPETGEYLSEDYSFCRRWLAVGGEIWADMKSRLIHSGPTAVQGDFSTQWSA